MISEESLNKFKELYKKEFKEDLSDEVVLEKAAKLLRLVELIYKPMKKEEYDTVKKRRR